MNMKNNPQVRIEPTSTILNRPEHSNTEQNDQQPHWTYLHYWKAGTTFVHWPEQSRIGHNYQAAYKSRMIMKYSSKLEKIKTRSYQNLHLPSWTGQNNPTPNRIINSHIEPTYTIEKEAQLSWTGQNNLELAITIKQHKNQEWIWNTIHRSGHNVSRS